MTVDLLELRPEAIEAANERAIATWRSLGQPRRLPITGGLSLSGDGAAVRFAKNVEVLLDADELNTLRAALAEALSGAIGTAEPGRNEPCPCDSGRKYQRCCGN